MVPNSIRQLTEEEKLKNHKYSVGAVLSTLEKSNYNWKYPYSKEWIINQLDKDTCAGNSYGLAKSIQEGKWLVGLFTWLMARVRSNMAHQDYGVSNHDMAISGKEIGVLAKEDSPYDNTTPREILVDSTKWDVPSLIKKSLPYISGTPVWVEPAYGLDAYDMWVASTEKFEKLYNKPCPAVFGLMWNYNMHAFEIIEVKEDGSGHDMVVIGREDEKAISLQSYGLEAGDEGEVKISRAIINRWARDFGMFIVIDATPEQVKWAVENGVKLDGNTYINILRSILNALKDLLTQLKQKTYGIFTR